MPTKIAIGAQFQGSTDEPFPKSVFRIVYDCLADQGYEVPSHDNYTVPDDETDLRGGAGIIPEFMVGANNDIPDLIRTGILFPFDLEETLDNQLKSGTSAPHVTSQFVNSDSTLRDAIIELDRRMKTDLAVNNVDRSVTQNTNHPPIEIVAYALATYAKGWLVESILASSDYFSKGNSSEDTDGKDLFDEVNGEMVQLKSVTSMASKSRSKLEAHNIPYCYYQFDCAGHIVVGEDPNEVNAVAADVKDISKTLIKRCHSYYEYNGRTYRYLWW